MPFSNGFEYESWAAAWCYRCSREPDCAHLTQAIVENVKPDAWVANRPDNLAARYICRDWEYRDAEA